MTLQKYLSHPRFSYLLYFNSTNKTETASTWETTNSKPPGPIVMIGQSETGSSNQIIFITLFSSSCTALLCLFPTLASVQTCRGKTILLSQAGMFRFFFIELYCAGTDIEHCWEFSKMLK
jgi:hypothetical protein